MTDSPERRPRPRPGPGPDDGAPAAGEAAAGLVSPARLTSPDWTYEPEPADPLQAADSPPWLGELEGTEKAPEPAAPDPSAVGPAAGSAPQGHQSALGVVTPRNRRARPPLAPRRPRRSMRQTRGPAAGFTALVLLALVSAFFAWVTAEPFWLAVRHSATGTATVTGCVGNGLDRRCTGTFASADGGFSRAGVPIMGDAPAPGTEATARMTSPRGARVYIGAGASGRAGLGVGLLLLCGVAIAWSTGALRLPTGRSRLLALAGCLAGPLALLGGMLAVTF